MTEQYKVAENIAIAAHRDQKYSVYDYFNYHVMGVVKRVHTYEHKIVAMLHDVVEDSDVTLEDLLEAGIEKRLVEAVALLTKTDDTVIEDYLAAIKENKLALVVKKADMGFNLENNIKEGNLARFTKYSEQMKILLA